MHLDTMVGHSAIFEDQYINGGNVSQSRDTTTKSTSALETAKTMADPQSHTTTKPVPIAPASAIQEPPPSIMPYSCQSCAKRKVKCDKATPICFSCRRSRLECVYQAPLPRSRKRKFSNDVFEKLARYERILHQHGLLHDEASSSAGEKSPHEPISLLWNEPPTSVMGKLLSGHDEPKGMETLSDEEEERQRIADVPECYYISDPLTGTLIGSQQSLLPYHTTYEKAMLLWKVHIENVEPILKILHIPSTAEVVMMVSQHPEAASRADECLLFAIYHFAVVSMPENECVEKLAQSRATLLPQYRFAARQAFVNASFLRTTNMSILQAFVLFLISCRSYYDPHTYWILTGVAVRIAHRMRLHRDGEKLGLRPFDVQMRRRLFYQLFPLDGIASQMSGTGMPIIPDAWDTKPPLNVNDDQIWPGMTEKPQEQNGATEMIFCLSRSCIGKFFARVERPANSTGSSQFNGYHEAESAINGAESEVEEKYIRYCDIVNPLHFLTIGLARAGITAMRLRVRLHKVKNQIATDSDKEELFQLARKILDTDAAANAHADLRKFQWHMKPFFLWGTWDSFIYVLTSLWRRVGMLSSAETNAAWDSVVQAYHNHDELLQSQRSLHVALRCLTLKAWDANPPSHGTPEPDIILTLQSLQRVSPPRSKDQDSGADILDATASGTDASLGNASGEMNLDISNDINFDAEDWLFWEQLIQDHAS